MWKNKANLRTYAAEYPTFDSALLLSLYLLFQAGKVFFVSVCTVGKNQKGKPLQMTGLV